MFPAIDSEAVVQQAIVDAAMRLRRKEPFDPLPFFRATIRHRAIAEFRKKTKEQQSQDALTELTERKAAVDPAIEQEHIEQIRHALELLPPMERMVITSRYMNGMTFAEMAKVMGITESTARVRAHRAIIKLRTMLLNES
jgi:RNA polymerase sigma factor (sigma-70 family)